MKIYVASTITNKLNAREVMDQFHQAGHEITVNWTLEPVVDEQDRNGKAVEVGSISVRDFAGVSDSDVFVLLAEPSQGRSMYVELGLALSSHVQRGSPEIFVVGEKSDQTIFYYHPAIRRARTIEDVFLYCQGINTPKPENREGKLEEFRALRSEMLQTMSDRLWGQATYAALAGGVLAFSDTNKAVPALLVLVLVFPFLFHTIFREQSRWRMANYILTYLEPKIPGMSWEKYLRFRRTDYGRHPDRGVLSPLARLRHLISLSGLYLIVSSYSLIELFRATPNYGLRLTGCLVFIFVLILYAYFWRTYDDAENELKKLQGSGFIG